MKYRQINPPVCEAVKWNGQEIFDKRAMELTPKHPAVGTLIYNGPIPCEKCGQRMDAHGFIADGNFTVCPGDYVVFTDFYYPLSAQEFEANYMSVVTSDEKADLTQSAVEINQALENLRARLRGLNPKTEVGAAIYKLREASHWLRELLEKL